MYFFSQFDSSYSKKCFQKNTIHVSMAWPFSTGHKNSWNNPTILSQSNYRTVLIGFRNSVLYIQSKMLNKKHKQNKTILELCKGGGHHYQEGVKPSMKSCQFHPTLSCQGKRGLNFSHISVQQDWYLFFVFCATNNASLPAYFMKMQNSKRLGFKTFHFSTHFDFFFFSLCLG